MPMTCSSFVLKSVYYPLSLSLTPSCGTLKAFVFEKKAYESQSRHDIQTNQLILWATMERIVDMEMGESIALTSKVIRSKRLRRT